MSSIWKVAVFALVTLYVASQVHAHSGGETGVTNRPGDAKNGCSCHCPQSSSTTQVTIEPLVPDTTIIPGGTYQFKVTVANSQEAVAGVDIAAWKGSLSAINAALRSGYGQLHHNSPQTMDGGFTSWTFKYKAPSGQKADTIYATGNAADGDDSEDNGDCTDQWNWAPKYVIHISTAGVSEAAVVPDVMSVWPNPVARTASIGINSTRAGEEILSLYDAVGRLKFSEQIHVTAGTSQHVVNTASLPAGEYLVRLSPLTPADGLPVWSEKLIVQH